MDAVIGKYHIRIEDDQIILTHEAGICFDLDEYELIGLQQILSTYLCAHQQETREEKVSPFYF